MKLTNEQYDLISLALYKQEQALADSVTKAEKAFAKIQTEHKQAESVFKAYWTNQPTNNPDDNYLAQVLFKNRQRVWTKLIQADKRLEIAKNKRSTFQSAMVTVLEHCAVPVMLEYQNDDCSK